MRRVVELELRMMIASGSIQFAVLSIMVLMAVAGFTGWRWQKYRLQQIDAVTAEAHERAHTWQSDALRNESGTLDARSDKPDRPYFVYGFFPQYTVARQSPLALLAVGQSDLFAYYDTRSIVTGPVLYHEEEIQNPSLSALGHFDVAFFLVIVLPVIIIALTFDLAASDRQTGRDRLLLAQGSTLLPVVAIRALMVAAIASATLITSLALLILCSAVTAESLPAAATIAFLVALCVVYVLFWCALAVLANARSASPARNAVLMLSIWGVLSLFAPAAIDARATQLYPSTGGAMDPVRERRRLLALNDTIAIAHLLHQDSLRGVYHDGATGGLTTVANAELERETVEERWESKRALLEKRQKAADFAAQFSPPLLIYSAFARAAYADVGRAMAFERGINDVSNRRSFATRQYVITGSSLSAAQIAALVPTALTVIETNGRTSRSSSATQLAILLSTTAILVAVGVARLR